MNQRERFNRVMHFQPVDRVPNIEIGYWEALHWQWREQGLPDIPFWGAPGDLQYARNSRELTQYFGLDAHNITFQVSISQEESPRPVMTIVEEDADSLLVRYSNGHVERQQRSNRGIAQELEWPVKAPADWPAARDRYAAGWHNLSLDRATLEALRERDYPASLWMFGFWAFLRRMMGFETACMAFYEEPDMVREMVDFWSGYLVKHMELALEVFTPELLMIHEDMAYNHGPMVSPDMAREFLVPCYARLAACAKARGVDILCIDCDGIPDSLIPVLYTGGINAWSPFEMVCREGHDTLLELGRRYPWLRMLGGMNKLALAQGRAAIDAVLETIPPLVKRGGFIPMIDHKVQEGVPLEAYRYYLAEKARRLAGCP